jgi:hypothetical protein
VRRPARTIGAVLRGATGAHVVCSNLRSVAWPARRKTVAGAPDSFQATAARRQIPPRRAIFKRQPTTGRRHHPTTNCGKLVTQGQCVRPYLCAQIQRGNVEAWTTRGLRMSKSACAQCTACFVTHAMRCCFPECIAMCAWRACMHTVLHRSAYACLLVPIFADHAGGAERCHAVRVVRAGLPIRPRRPSGHSRE